VIQSENLHIRSRHSTECTPKVTVSEVVFVGAGVIPAGSAVVVVAGSSNAARKQPS